MLRQKKINHDCFSMLQRNEATTGAQTVRETVLILSPAATGVAV
jgi:hypothetical protein